MTKKELFDELKKHAINKLDNLFRVKISCSNELLKIRSIGRFTLETRIPATGQADFDGCDIIFSSLKRAITGLSAKAKISFSLEDEALTLTITETNAVEIKANLFVQPKGYFSITPSSEKDPSMKIYLSDDVAKQIKKAEQFASRDAYRNVIASTCIRIVDGITQILSTDGRKVFTSIVQQNLISSFSTDSEGESNEVIIPREVCLIIANSKSSFSILKYDEDNLSRVIIETFGFTIEYILDHKTSPKYPDVNKAFPENGAKSCFVVNKNMLKSIINYAAKSTTSPKKKPGIIVDFCDDEISVGADYAAFSSKMKIVESDGETDGCRIKINPLFVKTILDSIDTIDVKIFYRSMTQPLIFTPSYSGAFKEVCLLMPLRWN